MESSLFSALRLAVGDMQDLAAELRHRVDVILQDVEDDDLTNRILQLKDIADTLQQISDECTQVLQPPSDEPAWAALAPSEEEEAWVAQWFDDHPSPEYIPMWFIAEKCGFNYDSDESWAH
ncbi:hypothetical protein BS78_02G356100 [Paspalum vaginatum]|nr:hypothetical protein BS78_02G356100 [Paspalum vaginatum]